MENRKGFGRDPIPRYIPRLGNPCHMQLLRYLVRETQRYKSSKRGRNFLIKEERGGVDGGEKKDHLFVHHYPPSPSAETPRDISLKNLHTGLYLGRYCTSLVAKFGIRCSERRIANLINSVRRSRPHIRLVFQSKLRSDGPQVPTWQAVSYASYLPWLLTFLVFLACIVRKRSFVPRTPRLLGHVDLSPWRTPITLHPPGQAQPSTSCPSWMVSCIIGQFSSIIEVLVVSQNKNRADEDPRPKRS